MTVLLATSIGSTVAAVATTVTALITNRRVGEVHTLTNRNFTEQKQEITDLRNQLEVLRRTLSTAESTRATLAAENKKDEPK